jgi:GTP-binding protein
MDPQALLRPAGDKLQPPHGPSLRRVCSSVDRAGGSGVAFQIKQSEFLVSVADPRRLPESVYPEIAFVGRSNVGKSSLINLLLGRKALAKVSGKPGKTRLINYFLVNGELYFVDLPGYGFARTSLEMRGDWGRMIEGYLLTPRPRLVVQLVDSRRGATRLDRESIEWLCYNGRETVVALTKMDKLNRAEQARVLDDTKSNLKELPLRQILGVSIRTRDGRDELLGALDAWLRKGHSR